MSVERKTCPYCGAPFRRRMKGLDYFKCGTAQNVTGVSPSQHCLWISYARVTAERDDLRRQLAQAQERINWLEGHWIAIRDMVSCDGDMVDDLIPYVEAVMEDYHAYHTQKRRLEREISQKQAQEQRDVALSSETANPYAAVVEAGRNFAVAAEQVLKAWDMDADVSDAIEELREAALDYAAVEAGEPEFEVEVIEIDDQLEAGAPRQSDFEGPRSVAPWPTSFSTGDGMATHPAARERPEGAFGEEGR